MSYQYSPLAEWKRFETLCRDLFRKELNDLKGQLYGIPGGKQHGIDIYFPNKNIGLQCKKKDILRSSGVLTKEEILEEIEKAKGFPHALDKLIFCTTLKKDKNTQDMMLCLSKDYQSEINFEIDIMFWEDINELLNKYGSIANEYYYTIQEDINFLYDYYGLTDKINTLAVSNNSSFYSIYHDYQIKSIFNNSTRTYPTLSGSYTDNTIELRFNRQGHYGIGQVVRYVDFNFKPLLGLFENLNKNESIIDFMVSFNLSIPSMDYTITTNNHTWCCYCWEKDGVVYTDAVDGGLPVDKHSRSFFMQLQNIMNDLYHKVIS